MFSRSVFLRCENAGFPASRRVIGEQVSYPWLGSDRVTRACPERSREERLGPPQA
ncbi:MAG: hypothetical protein PHY16_18365 [Methylobacter sp.]|nr:hypothetical protein [Methylobacter sp.]MDD5581218.1 hypothetical protein [Methylobacter sp.]